MPLHRREWRCVARRWRRWSCLQLASFAGGLQHHLPPKPFGAFGCPQSSRWPTLQNVTRATQESQMWKKWPEVGPTRVEARRECRPDEPGRHAPQLRPPASLPGSSTGPPAGGEW